MSSELQALQAVRGGAARFDAARLLREIRQDVPRWVEAVVSGTAAELESAAQRNAVASDRTCTAAALELLHGRRKAVVDGIVQAIVHQLDQADAPSVGESTMVGDRLTLTLIDEAQIDEDIECARIAQAIDAEAEAEMRQLAALVSGLKGLPGVVTAAMPLRPLECASALRSGLGTLAPDNVTRLFLLRHLGVAMGRELRHVYVRLAELLQAWGVQPAQYRVHQTPAAGGARSRLQPAPDGTPPGYGPQQPASHHPASHHAPYPPHPAAPQPGAGVTPSGYPTGPAPDGANFASMALSRLVERAARVMPALDLLPDAAPPADAAPAALNLRLLSDPLPAGTPAAPPIDPVRAVQLMERLFGQIEQQLRHVPAAMNLLQGLQEPGRTLARQEAQLWQNPDHPWWTFLDRLITLGSVHNDDSGQARKGVVTQSLAVAVERMKNAPSLDRAAVQAAADEVEALANKHLGERGQQLASRAETLQHEADRAEYEVGLRNQIVQQLRATPVCPGLRQLLVGPWVQAMAAAAARTNLDSPKVTDMAMTVDDLIRATAEPGRAVSRAQRAVLLRQVGEALSQADFSSTRVEAELADLQAILRDPPAVSLEEAVPDDPEQAADFWNEPAPAPAPAPTTEAMAWNAALPTVPVPFDADSTLEAESQKPWIDSLKPGDFCRLFLMGRWLTAQLSWVSDNHNLFLFTSRHKGRTHSLTRRMLRKLRSAGLAGSVVRGTMLAQAMQQVAESEFDADGA